MAIRLAQTLCHEISYFDATGNVATSPVDAAHGWTVADGKAWNEELGLGFSWENCRLDGMEEFRVPRDSFREEGANRFKTLIPNQGTIAGYEGDGSSLVIPFENGMLTHCAGKPAGEFRFSLFTSWHQCNMALFGITGPDRSIAVVIEDGQWDAFFRFRYNWGPEHLYATDVEFNLREYADEEIQHYDCVLRYRELDGPWQSVGRFYRDYVRHYHEIPTLKEKLRGNPVLEYAAKAISLRFRLAVKRLPHDIPDQTADNQPPLIVYMTFDMVRKVMEECRRQGVGPAEVNLVGWNYGGHDGAWPMLFPVEERLGGEESLVRNIRAIDALGYPVSLHEALTAGSHLAASFGAYDFDDVMLTHDGQMLKAGLLGLGRVLRTCSKQAMKYARRNFARTSKFPIRGSYFCDVQSIIGLLKCFHPGHPLERKGYAQGWKDILQLQHETFGSSFSEGAREWALPELDRAYMVASSPDVKSPQLSGDKGYPHNWFDQEIPLYEMVYHGSLIYNVYREGVNAEPGETVYLRSFAYGGTPLYYYHHLFHPEWTKANIGWTKDLLRYTSPEAVVKGVSYLKRATDDMARVAALQTEFIDDYIRHSDTLTQTVYGNSRSLWTNYAETPAVTPSGSPVPPRDFTVE